MTEIQRHLAETLSGIDDKARLVAVSKFHPAQSVREAYEAGQRIFGESRTQELVAKHEELPADIEWHFIGHLQQNKVKYIAPFISLIHSVDSAKLLEEINKQGRRCDRVIPCLLQLHVAAEETKFGFTIDECNEFLEKGDWRNLQNVAISGLMCMATNTDDEVRIRADFHTAYEFYKHAKSRYFQDNAAFCERSWGMSGDYKIAMEEGSTMVRIGTRIFGERNY